VPDVARSLPKPSADRRTYTFTIRPGFRFSPPSTEAVTAATFKDSIERSLNPRMKGNAAFYLRDIVGVNAFEAGKTLHVSGVRVRGNTLSIRLTGISGSFLSRLAMNKFCAVPIGTPIDPKGLPTIPSAGPYYIASYQPHRQLVLRRNPHYRGPRPHRLDEIDLALNVSVAQAVRDVETGQADYAAWQPITRSEGLRLAARYGPTSQLGRAGRQQSFLSPQVGLRYYALNTDRPLFASTKMRRAVNFAVDRRALQIASPGGVGLATDQYLPPGITGFKDAHIYPLDGPDLARARGLAGGQSRTAVLYTNDGPGAQKRTQVLVRNLAAIRIHVKVVTFPFDALGTKIATKGEPWDIADTGWVTDGYFDPFDFLNPLFDNKLSFSSNSTNTLGLDLGHFDDPALTRRLEAAAKLTGAARYTAYARLDADLTRNAAPILAYGNISSQDFFSARIGCQVYGPYGMNLAALCIRPHARP
jgi:peptide/nickel transport system substrate-binding protein